MPADVEEWLAERRAGPLGAADVVRYERISRGKGTDSNGTITVGHDGAVLGSGPVYAGGRGRLGGLRRKPRLRLDDDELSDLKAILATVDGAEPYQRDAASKGGDWEIVTRATGEPGAVIFENAERKVLDHLRDLARRVEAHRS